MIRTLATTLLVTVVLTATGFAQDGHVKAPTATAKAAPVAKAAHQATDAWQSQTTCPISGEKLDGSKEHFVDYEGQRIYVCCAKCKKKAAQKPEVLLFQMAKAGVAPATNQTTCVVSGKPLKNHDTFVEIGNKRIYTCCEKCASKAEKNPVKYLDKLEGRTVQTKCPFSGEAVEAWTVVDGYKVGACCEKCIAKIEKDPKPVLAKLAAQKVVLEPSERKCEMNPKKAGEADIFVTVEGKRHYFCCEKCQAKYMAQLTGKAKTPEESKKATLEGLGYLGGGH